MGAGIAAFPSRAPDNFPAPQEKPNKRRYIYLKFVWRLETGDVMTAVSEKVDLLPIMLQILPDFCLNRKL